MYLPTKIIRLVANGKYSGLTKSERLILPLMATNADKHTGDGALSIGSIARLTGLARNTVKKAYRSLADRGIIQNCGNKPGYGVTWRFIGIPDLRRVTPPDTVNRCMTVLIDNVHSTNLKLCTGTLDSHKKQKIKTTTKSKKQKHVNNKYPTWWTSVANTLTKNQRKTQAYRDAILRTWLLKGCAEIAHIKVNSLQEAQKFLLLQNTQENREAWTNTIKREMKKDIKPNGDKGHLTWVANHLVCEKCSAHVVIFRLQGEKAGARQWAPAVLGLLQRLSRKWIGPALVLKDDGWRESYTASTHHKKTEIRAKKTHNNKPKPTLFTHLYQTPTNTFLKPIDHSIWARTQQALQDNLHPQSYTTWIKPLNICHSKANVLWLECENQYAAEFISTNYMAKITATLQKIAPYQEVRLCIPGEGGQ